MKGSRPSVVLRLGMRSEELGTTSERILLSVEAEGDPSFQVIVSSVSGAKWLSIKMTACAFRLVS